MSGLLLEKVGKSFGQVFVSVTPPSTLFQTPAVETPT